MDKQQAITEIRATLEAARTEAGSLAQSVEWVVCYVEDATPFRVTETGQVMLAGSKGIWTGTQRHARALAKDLDAKVQASKVLEGRYSVCPMPASAWAPKRVCKLNEMLAMLDKAAQS